METEAKYYTPDISEFFVGFEYESSEEGRKIWIKEVFELDFGFGNELLDIYNEGYQCTHLRVKYLDSEDIENLGFNKVEDLSVYVQLYSKDVWKILWQPKTKKHGKGCLVIEDIHGVTHFRGHIKNKSELKKVLQMIGVI